MFNALLYPGAAQKRYPRGKQVKNKLARKLVLTGYRVSAQDDANILEIVVMAAHIMNVINATESYTQQQFKESILYLPQ